MKFVLEKNKTLELKHTENRVVFLIEESRKALSKEEARESMTELGQRADLDPNQRAFFLPKTDALALAKAIQTEAKLLR